MEEVGLREMRQNASELVRRAEGGEVITITVAGRPAAVLAPTSPRRWRRWEDVADVLRPPGDDDWHADSDLLDHTLRDPWEAR